MTMAQTFGWAQPLRVSVYELDTQKEALTALAKLARKSSIHPNVTRAAHQITADCPARNDDCELEAVYAAIKKGTDKVPGLERGVRYVSDASYADHFTAPSRLLDLCRQSACAGDCDDHSALVASLLASMGWQVGLKVWGPKDGKEFTNVFAVAKYPKKGPHKHYVALDTTVPRAKVGWEPPPGRTLTVWF